MTKYIPMKSMDVALKGAFGSSIFPNGATNSLYAFRLGHGSHFLIQSSTDSRSPACRATSN